MRKWAIKRYKAAKSQRACHSLLLTTSFKTTSSIMSFVPYVCVLGVASNVLAAIDVDFRTIDVRRLI